ncbi:MAG: cation-transporting P-type ATPase [Acidimicrobiales bacterium]|nr:cation-transporting P-type ATPase [Acidimicrobiales bacterium]
MREPVDARGLSSEEAVARRRADGSNALPSPRPPPAWREFVGEFTHFFALLFWVASGLAFVAGLPQLGVAVLLVLVLNAVFGFVQQQRAERAAERLKDLLPRRATVVRDGVARVVPAEDLVRGDLVKLVEGDLVSADADIVEAHGLAVDVSSLTGESVPDHPGVGSSVFAGSFVVEGESFAVVTATGARTRLAEIAGITFTAHAPVTPLRRELDRLAKTLAVVAVVVGIAFFVVSLVVGTPASDGFLFAVGVTVAVVPCGLLPTVTLSLAIGAQRMAGRHALVRNLEAVETLGSTTFICTDKTGTLTRNEMAVVEVWAPQGRARITGEGYEPVAEVTCEPSEARAAVRHIASVGRACSSGRIVESAGRWGHHGDPMEAALDALAHRVGADDVIGQVTARFPFDPRRRRMSVVVGDSVLVKGAPDALLGSCGPVPGAQEALERMAGEGLRVLALATRSIDGAEVPATAEAAERDLELLGLVGLEDPPRQEAAAALAACRRAGVSVAMVTGDHPATAAAIAREVGLAGNQPVVVLGEALPADDADLGVLVDQDGIVVARVAPEDKLRIARALQVRGHVVAMTGDGVNDAPALREAAIGVAMGASGTDVAREAADLVLLDDDFATIVVAIEQGRATFANIRRFLTYHLTDNVAELAPFVVWALSGGRFPLAIGVLQVLALDIGTDIAPALALGAEPPAPHLLDRKPTRRHLVDRGLLVRAFAWLGPTEAAVSLAAFVATFLAVGWRPGESFPEGPVMAAASGAAFTGIVLGQMANAVACRSTREPVWRLRGRRNPLLWYALVAEAAMLLIFLLVEPVASLLDQAPPSSAGVAVAALALPAVVVVDAVQKRMRWRGVSSSPAPPRGS